MASVDALPPTFTPAEAAAVGVPRHEVYVMRDAGEIVGISRGVYRKASAPATAHLDLIAATKRAPRAVVCLVSALAVHDLTDEIPRKVQIAVPRAISSPHIDYPPVQVSRFERATFAVGRTMFEAAPQEWIPIYDPERSVADVIRLRHLIGDAVAYRAVRAYLARPAAQPTDLLEMAERLGDTSALRQAIQVVLA